MHYVRNHTGLFVPKPVAPSSVRPSVIRSGVVAQLTGGATGTWAWSGSANCSGTEPNRALFIFSLAYDVTDNNAFTVDSLTIGGTAATQGVGFIARQAGTSRNMGTAVHYRIAPANNASLAVAGQFTGDEVGDNGLNAGVIYYALLKDVHQTTPLGASVGQANNGDGATATLLNLSVTVEHALSLLMAAFNVRSGAVAAHTAIDTEVILQTLATGGSATADINTSLVSEIPPATGAQTIGVNFNTDQRHGGVAIEVKAA